MRAYKFRNTWLDLDHVLGVGPVVFENRMGSGGYFIGEHLHDVPQRTDPHWTSTR